MTDKNAQTETIKQKLEILGWIIAFDEPIVCFFFDSFPQLKQYGVFGVTFWVVSLFLCFWDRQLLKTQDTWFKNKIAWGWCLLPPVYLYKRAKVLKESLSKFWICFILCVFSTIGGFQIGRQYIRPVVHRTIYKNCIDELVKYDVKVDTIDKICISKQLIFDDCVDNTIIPNFLCDEKITKINRCSDKFSKIYNISMDKALDFCICSVQYDAGSCLGIVKQWNKYE